jgi:hypothetical protein
MKKSIISNIVFTSSTWKIILFLSAFVILALAISKYMPFYTEGFQEGLLSSTAITSINSALEVYDSAIDPICSDGVKALQKLQLTTADAATITPILGDDTLKNVSKIDKVIALKSTDPKVQTAITTINTNKYGAVLTLLNTLNKTSYPDDETFTTLLKQQTQNAQNIVSGDTSVYAELKGYLKTISIVS